ncbi:unnamed protein product, partial [Timema podura]|nr:unnamed protein product [Timema podura]
KLVWVREEALSSIVAVEMLELPVSDTDAAIEQEFDHKETGILGMFVHRISSQIIQLRSSLMTLLGDRMSEGQSSGLVRDEFGLHKIIVAATASGKLFGIDNLSGEILWQRRLEDAAPFLDQTTDRKHMVLYVQRTTRHFPHPAQCLLLFQDKGLLLNYNRAVSAKRGRKSDPLPEVQLSERHFTRQFEEKPHRPECCVCSLRPPQCKNKGGKVL